MSAPAYTITLIGRRGVTSRRLPGTECGLSVAESVARSYLAQYPEYDLAGIYSKAIHPRRGYPELVRNVWREKK